MNSYLPSSRHAWCEPSLETRTYACRVQIGTRIVVLGQNSYSMGPRRNLVVQTCSATQPDQQPEATLRSLLVQPLSVQGCFQSLQLAELAADAVDLCFHDLSNQLVLPGHPVLGHVLLLPCNLDRKEESESGKKLPLLKEVRAQISAYTPRLAVLILFGFATSCSSLNTGTSSAGMSETGAW
jgi:hypothetical protein